LTAAADEIRTWTDDQGRKMQAQFVREVDGDATFLKDGKLVVLPLDKLSDEDQKFIRDAELNKKVEETAPPAGAPRPVDNSTQPFEAPAVTDSKSSLTKQKTVAEERTWRDVRGKPQGGKFVRIHQGSVVISSGSRAIRIPFHNLSRPDQEYLRDLLASRGELAQLPPGVPREKPTDSPANQQVAEVRATEDPSAEAEEPPVASTPRSGGSAKASQPPNDRIASRTLPKPEPARPSELVRAATNLPNGPQHVNHARENSQRMRGWLNPSRQQLTDGEKVKSTLSVAALLIGLPIGLVVGSCISAFVLRAAAYFVLGDHVGFGSAFTTSLVANLINGVLGFGAGFIYGAVNGSAEGSQVLSLVILPVTFLIQSGVISSNLDTDYGAACLVSLAMYAIWFVIGIIIVGAIFVFFAPMAAAGFVG
jgi:hypothetical protein